MYIAVCLLVVLNTFFLYFLSKYEVRFSFRLKGIGELVNYGFPLLLLSFFSVILLTIDRIMIAKMLGLTFVGYYSIGVMGRTYGLSASSHLSAVTIPRLLGEYGKRESIEDVKKFVIEVSLPICLVPKAPIWSSAAPSALPKHHCNR